MINTKPLNRTFVASANTDGIFYKPAAGDEDRINRVIAQWEKASGLKMERTEIVAHKQLHINSYIQHIRNEDGEIEVKSKGSMNCDPGIESDHNRLVVAKSINQFMLDKTPVEEYIQRIYDERRILEFTEMRSAPSSGYTMGDIGVGKLIRVYASTRTGLPPLKKGATEKADEQDVKGNFAVLKGIDWPEEDDVDIDFYITRAKFILEKTRMSVAPHQARISKDLLNLGFKVFAVGGSAAVIDDNGIFKPDNKTTISYGNLMKAWGAREIAVGLSGTGDAIAIAPGIVGPESRVLTYSDNNGFVGEIHSKTALVAAGHNVNKLIKEYTDSIQNKGVVTVYASEIGLTNLDTTGLVLESTVVKTPKVAVTVKENVPVSVETTTVTNDDFLTVMHNGNPHAFVCSSDVPPDSEDTSLTDGMWNGAALCDTAGSFRDDQRQNYTCISTFTPKDNGFYSRVDSAFEATDMVVLDDIILDPADLDAKAKIKVDPLALGFGEPTYILETSPGNTQWGYKLTTPITDISIAKYLTLTVVATPVAGQVLTDQGARNINRLMKLPQGRNLKLSLDKPFQNRLVSWNPHISYEAEDIAGWFGCSLDNAGEHKMNNKEIAGEGEVYEHPLYLAMEAAGLIKKPEVNGNGVVEAHCPNASKHGSGKDTGYGFKIHADGTWTAFCPHDTCKQNGTHDKAGLYRHLIGEGYSVTPPNFKLYDNVKRIDRASLRFGDMTVEDRADEAPDLDEGRTTVDLSFMRAPMGSDATINDIGAAKRVKPNFQMKFDASFSIWEHELTDSDDLDLAWAISGEGNARYMTTEKQWYFWQSDRWNTDNVGDTTNILADQIVAWHRAYMEKAKMDLKDITDDDEAKFLAKRIGSMRARIKKLSDANGRKAIRKAIEEDLRFAVDPSERNQDPNILGVKNGVVDLRAGKMIKASRDQHIFEVSPTVYDPEATCPQFEKFIKEITGTIDKKNMVDGYYGYKPRPRLAEYLQRALGSALFGHNKGQRMYVEVGGGANGKSLLNETITEVLGSAYTAAARGANLFNEGGSAGGATPQWAALEGKRFVTSSEPSMRTPLDAAIIKSLSGDAFINVRGLYQGSKDIPVTFTIFVACNELPDIDHFDSAAQSRLEIIPFDNKWARGVDKDHKLRPGDVRLKEKLLSEAPGILNWLLKGAADYAKNGFTDIGILEEVEIGSVEMSQELDQYSVWVEERLEDDDSGSVSAIDLYDDFKRWMQINRRNEKLPSCAKNKLTFSKKLAKTYTLDRTYDSHEKVNKYQVKFK
jgi:P4 family phage/plasmid primase-like protien